MTEELRVLDYFRECNAPKDERMEDAVALLISKRKNNIWLAQSGYPGKVYLNMEDMGKPGKWNTLRAMRVLDWRADGSTE